MKGFDFPVAVNTRLCHATRGVRRESQCTTCVGLFDHLFRFGGVLPRCFTLPLYVDVCRDCNTGRGHSNLSLNPNPCLNLSRAVFAWSSASHKSLIAALGARWTGTMQLPICSLALCSGCSHKHGPLNLMLTKTMPLILSPLGRVLASSHSHRCVVGFTVTQ